MPSPFPQVVICNSKAFTTDYASSFLTKVMANLSISVDDIGNSPLLASYLDTHAPADNQIFNQIEFARFIALSYAKSDEQTTNEERKRLGLTIDDMLISCVIILVLKAWENLIQKHVFITYMFV